MVKKTMAFQNNFSLTRLPNLKGSYSISLNTGLALCWPSVSPAGAQRFPQPDPRFPQPDPIAKAIYIYSYIYSYLYL